MFKKLWQLAGGSMLAGFTLQVTDIAKPAGQMGWDLVSVWFPHLAAIARQEAWESGLGLAAAVVIAGLIGAAKSLATDRPATAKE